MASGPELVLGFGSVVRQETHARFDLEFIAVKRKHPAPLPVLVASKFVRV